MLNGLYSINGLYRQTYLYGGGDFTDQLIGAKLILEFSDVIFNVFVSRLDFVDNLFFII